MIGDVYDVDDTTLAFERTTKPVPADERTRLLADPGFGRVFTDHMAIIEYDEKEGWHDARITARHAFKMDPASPVLHYAQEIFEGLKAYRRPDGGAALFRPDANARRFAKSAIRLAMPPLPEEMFLESVRGLVKADREWIAVSRRSLPRHSRSKRCSARPGWAPRPARAWTISSGAWPARTERPKRVLPCSAATTSSTSSSA
jgi:hypothetical protein